ncbi:hypothetical protein Tco_0321753 [Tanacetum coccineum]
MEDTRVPTSSSSLSGPVGVFGSSSSSGPGLVSLLLLRRETPPHDRTPKTEGNWQFQARKDTTPISVHNIYSFYESEPSDAESEEMGEVDIETLTME